MVIHSIQPAGRSLGETFDEGRWTPIRFTAELIAGSPPALIWARIGEGPFAWQVVYDGTQFAPLYQTTSQVVIDGAEHRFEILPLGGWHRPPELHVGTFVEASEGPPP